MKRQIQFLAGAVGVVVLVASILTAVFWSKQLIWPEFPQSSDVTPQMIAKVEPDFSWRIGDPIPVDIYIKQPAGVSVDVNSLAIEGDFEISGNPTVFVKHTKSGAKLIHLGVTLQGFNAAKKLGFNLTMSYKVDGIKGNRTVTLAGPDVYTSQTWDGREEIKDGPLPVVIGYHYLTSAIALVVGAIGLILGIVYYRRFSIVDCVEEEIPPTRWQTARREFDETWAKIQEGDDSDERYKEIVRIIRRLYYIEAKIGHEIPFEIGYNHPHLKGITIILGHCEQVLFGHRKLTPGEKAELRKAFDEMIPPPKAGR